MKTKIRQKIKWKKQKFTKKKRDYSMQRAYAESIRMDKELNAILDNSK